jgi:hypothetical protein
VKPDDVFGVRPDGNQFLTSVANENTWPVGTMVFSGTIPHLVPDWKSAAKTAMGAFFASREHPALKVFALFTEKVGSFAGLGQGMDFTK